MAIYPSTQGHELNGVSPSAYVIVLNSSPSESLCSADRASEMELNQDEVIGMEFLREETRTQTNTRKTDYLGDNEKDFCFSVTSEARAHVFNQAKEEGLRKPSL